MNNREAYEQAKQRVEAKYGFFVHLTVYVLVNLLLIVINLSSGNEVLWFTFPLVGWGIGLMFHALSVFVFAGRGSLITEKMIEKELKRRA